MKQSDLSEYFDELNLRLSSLKGNQEDRFIFSEFPNYPHIGKYVDPRPLKSKEHYLSILKENLNEYSFDPLISFKMNQPKYSVEILHPDCRCFRRSKVKERPIKTTSHRDRILFAGWNHFLSKKHKRWVNDNSLNSAISAYIPKTGKFNAHYSKLAFDYIQNRNEYSAVALDIKSFFDNVPHANLKKNLITLLDQGDKLDHVNFRLFKATTNYTYIELDELKPTLGKFDSGTGMYMSRSHKNWDRLRKYNLIKKNSRKGIPQGLPCSGVLANIAMMDFDLFMNNQAKTRNAIYIRYADDIFIAAATKIIVDELFERCSIRLNQMNLPIACKKTEKFDYKLSSIEHPTISYLGLNCNGNNISVRQNGVNKFYQRTSQYIYSYVLTCKRRGITPSKKKIRAIFSHSGRQNFYSYLRRVSKVFGNDPRYNSKLVKSILKNHVNWINKTFNNALSSDPPKKPGKFIHTYKCNCPLKRDG